MLIYQLSSSSSSFLFCLFQSVLCKHEKTKSEITNVNSMLSQMPSHSAMSSFNGDRNTNKINKQVIVNCDEQKNMILVRKCWFLLLADSLRLSIYVSILFTKSNNFWHAQWAVRAYSNCVIWLKNKAFHTQEQSWRQPQRQRRSETKIRSKREKKLTRVIVFSHSFYFEAEKVRLCTRTYTYTNTNTNLCIYAIRNVFICWMNGAQLHLDPLKNHGHSNSI